MQGVTRRFGFHALAGAKDGHGIFILSPKTLLYFIPSGKGDATKNRTARTGERELAQAYLGGQSAFWNSIFQHHVQRWRKHQLPAKLFVLP